MPTEFGMLKKMEWAFRVHGNEVTGAIPTEVGNLSNMYGNFHLASNDLCSDIPTELSALSTSLDPSTYPSADPTYWSVAEGNYVGPTPCPAVSALVALYEGTGGSSDGWTSATHWMNNDGTQDSKDPCENSWYGVTCDSGNVTQLSLGGNALTGTLPTEMGLLTSMENDFKFHSNSFSTTLPTELGEFTNFRDYFHIGHSGTITGSIPSQLGRLTLNTRGFYLHNNNLNKTVPTQLGRMISLDNPDGAGYIAVIN